MKRRQGDTTRKLQLAKETIRQLVSEDLQGAVVGGACPSRTGCSNNTGESLNECGSLYCSMIQY